MKQQQVITKSEDERKTQRKQIEELEARLTQLELTRRALEGDMQRLRMVITERDAENQACGTLHLYHSIQLPQQDYDAQRIFNNRIILLN